jgi:hypothetical protein
MEDALKLIVTVVGVLCLMAILMGLPLQLLWNWLMPRIFGLPTISFWEAVGLNVISSILFKTTVNSKKD